MGGKLSRLGVQTYTFKVKAIQDMPTPRTKTEVQRVLGMINYLGKFIPNLSANTSHLRQLLKTDVEMHWYPEHEKEWSYIKTLLCEKPILQYFDISKPTKISTDASRDGLGAVLLQLHGTEWKPVAYASRSLTASETRYAQIEKETLGLVFGCERFHEFVYGKIFLLETDHKPLIAISKKGLSDIPPRLQRMFIRLLKYHFEIIYTPGKHLVLADALSRTSLPISEPSSIDEDIEMHVHMIMDSMPVSEQMLQKLRQETQSDQQLQALMMQILMGWPNKNMVPEFKAHWDEFTIVNGLVLKGSRIVVPQSLKSEMLTRIHEGHLGIEKSKRRGRQLLYWPHMNSDIENMVKSCSTCQKYQYKQQKEPFIHRDSKGPWLRVGVDMFYHGGKSFLLVIDSYSNYPEVEELSHTSSADVISSLKKMWARHGIPEEVNTDNGPQFSSVEFRRFALKYEFDHITSSPNFPQSNGLAEKGVQIVKRLLKKALDSNMDWELALLNYRSTPLDDGRSPAEHLMGRKLRNRLPSLNINLNKEKRNKFKRPCGGKQLEDLNPEDIVRIHSDGHWPDRAKVLAKVAPRSYNVVTEDNQHLRRNRAHLLKTRESFVPKDLDAFPQDFSIQQQEPTASCSKEIVTETKDLPMPLPLRRSSRVIKPPERLNL